MRQETRMSTFTNSQNRAIVDPSCSPSVTEQVVVGSVPDLTLPTW